MAERVEYHPIINDAADLADITAELFGPVAHKFILSNRLDLMEDASVADCLSDQDQCATKAFA